MDRKNLVRADILSNDMLVRGHKIPKAIEFPH